MPASVQRTGIVLLAGAALFLAPLGCEKPEETADRQVEAKLRDAVAPAQPTDVPAALQQAAAINDASSLGKVQANSALAQAELDAAAAVSAEVHRSQASAADLLSQIGQLVNRLQTANSLVASYRQSDPSGVRQTVASRISEIEGSAQLPQWKPTPQTSLPTLWTVHQQITSLGQQIAQRQEKIKSLTQQRSRLLEQADDLDQQSTARSGEESVALFKQAAELRKRAADLSVQMESLAAQIAPLQADLGVAQGQQKILESLIEQLRQRESGAVKQQPDAQIEAQNKIARQIATEGDRSIASLAAQLGTIVAQEQQDGAAAEDLLRKASGHYKQAASAADALNRELRELMSRPANANAPQQAAWKKTLEAYQSSAYIVQQALAEQMLGNLLTARAQALNNRLDLAQAIKPVYAAARFEVPAELQEGSLADELQEARAQALEAYASADELLERAMQGPGQANQKAGAFSARIFTLYGWAQALKDAGDAAAAAEKLQLAEDVRQQAADQNVKLLVLPSGLSTTRPATTR